VTDITLENPEEQVHWLLTRRDLPGRARALRMRRPRNRQMRPGRWPTTLMESTEPPNLISIGGPAGNSSKRADKRFALQPVPSLQIEFYFEKGASRSNGEGVPIQCGFRRQRKRQSGAIGANVPAIVPPVRVQSHMQTVTQVCKPVYSPAISVAWIDLDVLDRETDCSLCRAWIVRPESSLQAACVLSRQPMACGRHHRSARGQFVWQQGRARSSRRQICQRRQVFSGTWRRTALL